MLKRGSGVALWRQIAQEIETRIREGEFAPGQQLPTEMELTRRFDVNRHTVRRALAALTEDGIVRAEQGRGTFVQEDVVDYRIGRRTRFRETLRGQAKDPGGRLLAASVVPAEAPVALALEITPGEAIVRLDTLRLADGVPLIVGSHYFPEARFAGIEAGYRDTGSITEALKICGIEDYFRRTTRVTARLPDSGEMRLLALPRSRPVLVAESVNVDADGRPVEFGVARFAADRVHLVFEP